MLASRWLRFAALTLVGPAVGGGVAAAPLEDVVTRVKASVVAVGTLLPTRNPAFTFRGTGFVIGDGTLVATNAHVLPQSVDTTRLETVAVVVPRGSTPEEARPATVVATDREHDVAILRIAGKPLAPAQLATQDVVREGQSAAFTGFPIGSALGLFPATHRATISAITPIALPSASAAQLDVPLLRRLQGGAFDVLQLDATAYPGNSGSPLFDASSGTVIGIVNMVFVKTTKEAMLAQPSGITFAVPIAHVKRLLAEVPGAAR